MHVLIHELESYHAQRRVPVCQPCFEMFVSPARHAMAASSAPVNVSIWATTPMKRFNTIHATSNQGLLQAQKPSYNSWLHNFSPNPTTYVILT